MEKSKEISSTRYASTSPIYTWTAPTRPSFLVKKKRRKNLDLRQRLSSHSLVKDGLEVGVFGTILATFLSSLWLLG